MKKKNWILTMVFVMVLTGCNSKNRATTDDLIGRWDIVSVNGEQIKKGEPFFEFFKENEALFIHGNIGCNLMNAEVLTDAQDAAVLSFTEPAVTLMACPDMDTENKILEAVEHVARVKGGESTTQMLLVDKDGKTLFTLEKSVK